MGSRIGSFLLLALCVVGIYGQTLSFDFTNLDDRAYVSDNDRVQDGLSVDGVAWAFTTLELSNWHPLTWLSLMLDAQIAGAAPGQFHQTNLLLHLANTLLLFHLLTRMTRESGRSLFVAALFAVHPLHVESVAWIAERKDVLSTLFWFLALLAYLRWVEQPGVRRYLVLVLMLVLGLLAKPMLVTLPLTLLLLDRWPLGRFDEDTLWRLIREKLPLLLIAAGSAAVTLVAQQRSLGTLEAYSLAVRLANGSVAYLSYMVKMLWPSRLAAFYPHPGETISIGLALVSAALLIALSLLAFRVRGTRPYLLVGWVWYLVTLIPVIGLVQVGQQALADRYTYVPLIGLFVCVAWGVPELLRAAGPRVLAACGALVVGLLAGLAHTQTGTWRDGVTLFEHALRVTADNPFARNNLGTALYRRGRLDEAVVQFNQALRLRPDFPEAHANLGNALARQGRTDGAVEHWEQAIRMRPDHVTARCNLAGVLFRRGQTEEVVRHCREVLRSAPDAACAHYNLGMALLRQGAIDDAATHLAGVLEIEPDYVDARLNLGVVRYRQGRVEEAIEQFSEVLRLDPDHAAARKNLAIATGSDG